jgi:hypothetical protein
MSGTRGGQKVLEHRIFLGKLKGIRWPKLRKLGIYSLC